MKDQMDSFMRFLELFAGLFGGIFYAWIFSQRSKKLKIKPIVGKKLKKWNFTELPEMNLISGFKPLAKISDSLRSS